MTICPIAIVAGCKKCPAFSVCPLKTVIGDAEKQDAAKANPGADKKKGRTEATASRRRMARYRSGVPISVTDAGAALVWSRGKGVSPRSSSR